MAFTGILGNAGSLYPVKDCKKCVNRKDNECGVFKMTLRPDMMCKGNFYSKSKRVGSN